MPKVREVTSQMREIMSRLERLEAEVKDLREHGTADAILLTTLIESINAEEAVMAALPRRTMTYFYEMLDDAANKPGPHQPYYAMARLLADRLNASQGIKRRGRPAKRKSTQTAGP